MTDFHYPEVAIERALRDYPTPFYLYDTQQLQANHALLTESMDAAGVRGFKNFFAVKALPNPHILQRLVAMGQGFDCSSLAELELANQVGARGADIMFTSNNTTDEEFARAHELGAIINFDALRYVERYVDHVGVPEIASCRYNPGELVFGAPEIQKLIGAPAESKFGMSRERLLQSYQLLKEKGVTRFGLHTMLLSNNLSWQHHSEIAHTMFMLAAEVSRELDITFEFINLGGGIGVAYRPEDEPFEYDRFAEALQSAYQCAGLNDLGMPAVYMENGRCISASTGWLVTTVQNVKESYKKYIGVDASMADLMRPGMYGAYHHVSLLGDDSTKECEIVDIVGSLCENNDKFARDRQLPLLHVGDVIVIHSAGAHGHSMGFNYNGRLRHAELLHENGKLALIRRAETLDDLFRTIMPLEEQPS